MRSSSNKTAALCIAAACIAFILFFLSVLPGDEGTGPAYGAVSEADYLRGKFDPVKHPLFVKVEAFGIPCDRPHYLRKEAAEALAKMYAAMKKDIPNVKFWVQSSTRNWDVQKRIWELRWRELTSGKKKMGDREIAARILRSSAMPGTSRHHWGADFDINILRNAYYDSGDGRKIYAWLKVNAGRFGFCQPYTAGRKDGYMEERWHWSYLPLAEVFQRRWNTHFRTETGAVIKDGGFPGADAAIEAAPVYVNSINPACGKAASE